MNKAELVDKIADQAGLNKAEAERALNAFIDSVQGAVAADDKVFLIGQGGQVSVVKAAGEWEVMTVNELDDECFATPAISDGHIYIRTRSALYSFGK